MDQEYYPKLGGSAGSKGVDYQLRLLLFHLLQGYHKDEKFKLSTENTEAPQFDDVVYEYETGLNTILLQAKHSEKENHIKNANQLFHKKSEAEQPNKPISDIQQNSNESKEKGDFNLFKYLKGFQKIKSDNIQNLIICTNCKIFVKKYKPISM